MSSSTHGFRNPAGFYRQANCTCCRPSMLDEPSTQPSSVWPLRCACVGPANPLPRPLPHPVGCRRVLWTVIEIAIPVRACASMWEDRGTSQRCMHQTRENRDRAPFGHQGDSHKRACRPFQPLRCSHADNRNLRRRSSRFMCGGRLS